MNPTPTQRAWLVDRLKELARLRGSRAPAQLDSLASALSGFDEVAVDEACHKIEREETESGKFKRSFPSLGRLLNECRRAAQQHPTHSQSTHWTIERYRMCKAFDLWLKDEVYYHKRSLDDLCARYPQQTVMWAAWKRQLADGTINCPGWCDHCDSAGWTIEINADGDHFAHACGYCRR